MQKKSQATLYNYSNNSMDRELSHHNQPNQPTPIARIQTSLEEKVPTFISEPSQVVYHHRQSIDTVPPLSKLIPHLMENLL